MSVKNIIQLVVTQVLVIGLILMGTALYNSVKQNAFLEVKALTAQAHLEDLKRHHDEMDKATATMAETNKAVINIQKDIRTTIRKAMKDETYKIWHESPLPPAAIRVLREAADAYGVRTEADTRDANNGVQAASAVE